MKSKSKIKLMINRNGSGKSTSWIIANLCFFFNYPYLNTTEPSIIISPSMWNSTLTSSPCPSKSLKEEPLNVTELYMAGYKDSLKNKHILDNIFYGLEYHI